MLGTIATILAARSGSTDHIPVGFQHYSAFGRTKAVFFRMRPDSMSDSGLFKRTFPDCAPHPMTSITNRRPNERVEVNRAVTGSFQFRRLLLAVPGHTHYTSSSPSAYAASA